MSIRLTKSRISTVVTTIGDAIAVEVVEGVDGASSESGLFKFGDIAATGVVGSVAHSETAVASSGVMLLRFRVSPFTLFTSVEDMAPNTANDDVEAPLISGEGLKYYVINVSNIYI